MIHGLLFWFFTACIAVQCCYALYFFTRVFTLPRPRDLSGGARRPVSIIICAKNEARNLEKYLPAVLTQHYADRTGSLLYEVLVVNDASTDDSEAVLQGLQRLYSHLRYVNIGLHEPRRFKGKKFALSIAAEQVQNEWLLMTDADCRPASDQWLAYMTEPLARGREIVCGYGAYRRESGFLNGFIRWETLHSFIQYSSYTAAGLPYMAVGRNLACTKEVLLRAQRSEVWNALPSGDDDLLIQACSTERNTEIVAHPDAFTVSEPKTSWGDWLRQKQRHLSTGKFYRPQVRQLLGGYALSHAFSWLLFLVLLFFDERTLVLLFFLMRCSIYWVIWETAALRMRERGVLRRMPLYDLSWALYNFVLSPFIFFKNKQQWK